MIPIGSAVGSKPCQSFLTFQNLQLICWRNWSELVATGVKPLFYYKYFNFFSMQVCVERDILRTIDALYKIKISLIENMEKSENSVPLIQRKKAQCTMKSASSTGNQYVRISKSSQNLEKLKIFQQG